MCMQAHTHTYADVYISMQGHVSNMYKYVYMYVYRYISMCICMHVCG